MKKLLPLLIVSILVLVGFGAVAIPIEKSTVSQPELLVKVRGGFGVHLVIENIGDADATDVTCFIFIYGSWQGPFPNSDLNHLGTIAPGQSVRFSFRPWGFGIGLFSDLPRIQVLADCAERSYFEVNKNAIILHRLIILI